MIERPILFSAPMVRALLAGTKTQTRRIIKSRSRKHPNYCLVDYGDGWWPYLSDDGESSFTDDGMEQAMDCPYGEAGGKLWVRETWAPDPPIDDTWASTEWDGCGRAIRDLPERFRGPDHCIYMATWDGVPENWTPSIHMPRWASRITLEVAGVRAEALQDISEADAKAEGAPDYEEGIDPPPPGADHEWSFRGSFIRLWESINGPGSWEANPWVWVIEFRRVA